MATKTRTKELAVDLGELLARVDHDREILNELLGVFRTELPRHLEILKEAVAGGDLRRVEITGHALKGMLSNISAAPAAALAARIETMGRENQQDDLDEGVASLELELSRLLPLLDARLGQPS